MGPCSPGVPTEQPRVHGVHGGLQCPAEAGHGRGGDQLPRPEAASEGRRGDAVWWATLPRLQWHEPLQFSYLLQVQELSGGLFPQVNGSVLPVGDPGAVGLGVPGRTVTGLAFPAASGHVLR